MLNHGFSTGALFLLVGMIYERRHTRLIEEFGGLWKKMSVSLPFFIIVVLSSIGLPGLNGFVGEFLILLGVFRSNPIYAAIAATGVILAAAYMLWMFQRVMLGEITKPQNEDLKDLSSREILVLSLVVIFIFWIGIYPQTFLNRMEPTINSYIELVKGKVQSHQKMGDRHRGVFLMSIYFPTVDLFVLGPSWLYVQRPCSSLSSSLFPESPSLGFLISLWEA